MQTFLNGLRAAGEPTRLRLLAILEHAELTVSEITRVLGQSQPRVSRHLKLLCEAGLLDRSQEGACAFYRLADHDAGSRLTRALLALLPPDDPQLAQDRLRLEAVKRQHSDIAAAYFRENAAHWDRIRSLHIAESEVEKALLEAAGDGPIEELLDLGTGTGRMLQVFADRIRHGLGIDRSREMLAVARANLERADLRHCHVRQADIYRLPIASASVDVVTVHHVLHFLDDPPAAISEAARVLRARGRLLIVDFAPHSLEFLRSEYAHRRLGFADAEIIRWCESAGLVDVSVQHLATSRPQASNTLTVSLCTGVQPR